AAERGDAGDGRVLLAGVALRRGQPLGIRHLGVAELERVAADEVRMPLLERARVGEIAHVRACRDTEMMATVWARPEVLLEHRLEQRFAAAVALGPQPLGHLGAVGLRRL